MRKLVYAMGVSLDGFIAAPNGEIDWSAPDEELHEFHNQQARETGVQLYGRRLYEEMAPWEHAEQRRSASERELAFASIWKETPKIVFSTTLEQVTGNAEASWRRSGSQPERMDRCPNPAARKSRPNVSTTAG
ncbi:MAG: hypothetical protein QOF85_2078 [Solirubrobacterales bacterium]|jgi:dihydrofolate reductase|nr:hypothetical protein [Solirubrobacterales bacterium]